MRLTISARHMELTDALKTHVENRLEKVKGHFDRVIDAEAVLSVEKHRHIAEVTVHANGVRMHSEGSSSDMYASIDTAIDRLHKQIHKFKDRVGRYVPVKIGQATVLDEEGLAVAEPLAVAAVAEGDGVVVTTPRPVIHREKLTLKPMSVDEALLQLDLLQDDFLVFTNSETQQINVVYRKENGAYGVIEPQY